MKLFPSPEMSKPSGYAVRELGHISSRNTGLFPHRDAEPPSFQPTGDAGKILPRLCPRAQNPSCHLRRSEEASSGRSRGGRAELPPSPPPLVPSPQPAGPFPQTARRGGGDRSHGKEHALPCCSACPASSLLPPAAAAPGVLLEAPGSANSGSGTAKRLL